MQRCGGRWCEAEGSFSKGFVEFDVGEFRGEGGWTEGCNGAQQERVMPSEASCAGTASSLPVKRMEARFGFMRRTEAVAVFAGEPAVWRERVRVARRVCEARALAATRWSRVFAPSSAHAVVLNSIAMMAANNRIWCGDLKRMPFLSSGKSR
jgi:hypothetical protein